MPRAPCLTWGAGALPAEWGFAAPSLEWAEKLVHALAAASGSPVRFLFLFSSSAMSCLCCLFASMVKEMSGALLCWVGCCKTCGLHYLILGMGTQVCLRKQESWDVQTRKKKQFLSKQKKQIYNIKSPFLSWGPTFLRIWSTSMQYKAEQNSLAGK